jgi:hypothetical protein
MAAQVAIPNPTDVDAIFFRESLVVEVAFCRRLWGSSGVAKALAPLRAGSYSFPSACFYGTTVYGDDKCGTKEKARPCSDRKRGSSRRAVAPLRACRD